MGTSLATTPEGEVFLGAFGEGSVDVGGQEVMAGGGSDVLIAKFLAH